MATKTWNAIRLLGWCVLACDPLVEIIKDNRMETTNAKKQQMKKINIRGHPKIDHGLRNIWGRRNESTLFIEPNAAPKRVNERIESSIQTVGMMSRPETSESGSSTARVDEQSVGNAVPCSLHLCNEVMFCCSLVAELRSVVLSDFGSRTPLS